MSDKKKNLDWYANTNKLVNNIEIVPYDTSNNIYEFCLKKPDPNWKQLQKKNAKGLKQKYTQYYRYPFWKIYFRDKIYNKDSREMFNYLIDSLLEYNPLIVFKSQNCQPIYSNLLKIHFNDYGNSKIQSPYDRYYIKFRVELEKPIHNLPKKLKNAEIVIKSKLLPNSQFEYGFCGVLDGRFRNCTLHQYFTYGGGSFETHPWGYCQTFNKAKGNSNIKCKIDVGT